MNVQASLEEIGQSLTQGKFPWRSVGIVSVLLMELSLIVPWIQLISKPLDPAGIGILLAWFLIFALAARGVYHMSDEFQLRNSASLVLSAALLLIGILISLNLVDGSRSLFDFGGALRSGLGALPGLYPMRPELPIMVLVVVVWRRGIAAASSHILEPARTSFKFRMGVLVLVAFTIFTERGHIHAAIPVFFFSSLLGMSLTRADHLTRLRGSSDPPFTFQWLLSLGGLFLLTLSAGVGLGYLLSSVLALRLLVGLRNLMLALLTFLYRLSLPLLIALEPLLQGLLGRLHLFMLELQSADPESLDQPGAAAGQLEGIEPPAFFQRINDFFESLLPYWPTVRVILISSIFLLILISAIRLVQRRSKRFSPRDRAADEGEIIGIGLQGTLRDRLNQWRQDVRSWGQALTSGHLSTAIVVRRLYARLLNLAEDYGRSRYRWETPLEFQAALGRLFPEVVDDIEKLTDAYIRVRYGEIPETGDMVAEVRMAWQRVQEEYE
ncbi:MAG: DUF4129 domain-containing protein [Anaerolineales bacterium]